MTKPIDFRLELIRNLKLIRHTFERIYKKNPECGPKNKVPNGAPRNQYLDMYLYDNQAKCKNQSITKGSNIDKMV